MEETSVFNSDPGIILTSIEVLTETILNNLSNSELIKCKLVCSFWKEIIDRILSGRIIIVTKKIPFKLSKLGIAQPKLLLSFLGFPQDFQFVAEYSQFYKLDRRIAAEERHHLPSAIYFMSMDDILDSYFDKIHSCQPLPSNGLIDTQIAIFPSHPEVKLHHFFFYSEQIHGKEKLPDLKELTNVPKDELKCMLLFMNEQYRKCRDNIISNMTIPTVVLSSIFLSHKHSGIVFSGKRLNAFLIKMWDEESTFPKYVEEIQKFKIGHHNCVAFLFSNCRCRCPKRNGIFSSFKESFPDVPILFFSNALLYDLTDAQSNKNHILEQYAKASYIPLTELIVLLWLT